MDSAAHGRFAAYCLLPGPGFLRVRFGSAAQFSADKFAGAQLEVTVTQRRVHRAGRLVFESWLVTYLAKSLKLKELDFVICEMGISIMG